MYMYLCMHVYAFMYVCMHIYVSGGKAQTAAPKMNALVLVDMPGTLLTRC